MERFEFLLWSVDKCGQPTSGGYTMWFYDAAFYGKKERWNIQPGVVLIVCWSCELRRQGGGSLGQKLFQSYFHICCSPAHPLSKMGSLASQLFTVAEIWFVEVGSFSAVFVDMYRKIREICLQIFAFFQKFEPPDSLIDLKLGLHPQRH